MIGRVGERERLLTIVGGGPTGVEMAGAVVELARKALAHDVAGEPLPGIAPVAKQQGAYVAEAIQPGSSPACAPPSNPTGWAVVTTMLARRTDKKRLERPVKCWVRACPNQLSSLSAPRPRGRG